MLPNTKEQPTGYYTWSRKNLFDPATIKKSMTITKWERVKLILQLAKYSLDSDDNVTTITKYKIMNGRIYILEVNRREKTTGGN